jgi:hypothetical protein
VHLRSPYPADVGAAARMVREVKERVAQAPDQGYPVRDYVALSAAAAACAREPERP